MNQVWKEHEKAFIKENANIMKDKELATRLTKITGRIVTIQAVRKQRQKLGVTKARGRGICAVVQDEIETQSDKIAKGVPTAQPLSPFHGIGS